MDMCMDVCTGMRVNMCMATCMDMRTGMHITMCLDMCPAWTRAQTCFVGGALAIRV